MTGPRIQDVPTFISQAGAIRTVRPGTVGVLQRGASADGRSPWSSDLRGPARRNPAPTLAARPCFAPIAHLACAMAELTRRMMLSSLLGYIALGASVAAFVPIIMMNSVKRVSGTGPGFLLVWLAADLVCPSPSAIGRGRQTLTEPGLQLNLVGVIVLKAALTQKALAAWYLIADSIMLVQMLFFGHDDLKWRPPQPAKAAVRIENRKNTPWYHALTQQFMEFSIWDDIKLLGFCVMGGIAVWGLYLTLGLYNDPEHFAIEIPLGYHPASFCESSSSSLVVRSHG